MKYYKMIFKVKDKSLVQNIELIDDYLGCLYKNGQVVDYESIYTKADLVFCNVILPEAEAIYDKNNNDYVLDAKSKVEQVYSIDIEELGENWYLDGKSCNCNKSSHYILICNTNHTESPITCGDCKDFVPLYTLPKILKEKDFYTVCEFERECRAIEHLWISGLNDKFMLRQRNGRRSPLVKKGRKICKAFEKATGVKFYLHIPFDDDSNSEKCPFCGKSWVNDSGYKCDDCHLVATKDTIF